MTCLPLPLPCFHFAACWAAPFHIPPAQQVARPPLLHFQGYSAGWRYGGAQLCAGRGGLAAGHPRKGPRVCGAALSHSFCGDEQSMALCPAQVLGGSIGRWRVEGIEVMGSLLSCLIHSTSLCWVPAMCHALHWRYDGKKDAALSKRLTTEDLDLAVSLPLSTCGCCGNL